MCMNGMVCASMACALISTPNHAIITTVAFKNSFEINVQPLICLNNNSKIPDLQPCKTFNT